jgi:hypothetical protein
LKKIKRSRIYIDNNARITVDDVIATESSRSGSEKQLSGLPSAQSLNMMFDRYFFDYPEPRIVARGMQIEELLQADSVDKF